MTGPEFEHASGCQDKDRGLLWPSPPGPADGPVTAPRAAGSQGRAAAQARAHAAPATAAEEGPGGQAAAGRRGTHLCPVR